jgi:CheY-like chemotaxis protein
MKMAVRTLMVDDSLDARDTLRHHLECIGCEVVAETGATSQVLDLFRTLRPALVALRAGAPQAGGRRLETADLIRLIRNEDRTVPILVVGSPNLANGAEAPSSSEDLQGCVVSPLGASQLREMRSAIGELFGEPASAGPRIRAALPNRGSSAGCAS